MPEDVALEDRVAALERAAAHIRGDICEARSAAAIANLNALDANQALARTDRELRSCVAALGRIAEKLAADDSSQVPRVEFVIGRLERVLEDVARVGEQ